MRRISPIVLSCLGAMLCAFTALAAEPVAPDFNREVRPILSAHCFKCHGPDAAVREAGLRLDQRDGATAKLESEAVAIVPGKPDASELVRRITSSDEGEVMPPPAANKPLSPAQKDVLRRWIASGAPYAPHWAFVRPRQAPLPKVKQVDWPKNAIDHFILARLEAAELAPSPPADKYTLARRVALDLIGMPPTPAEADAFVNDPDPNAYEKYVDRLLDSPHYGERWARRWLDLARYADTNGYEKDRPRSMWPYRDWVIGAINADLPFDQFTIKQLAGDMLPGATLEDRIATGFHRNTMINEEGGIDPLEFRYHATVDRINTTATVWLGLTLGCAQCHTHKFDPIPHHDYYRLMAFLNNADEPELDVPEPEVTARRAKIEAEIAALQNSLADRFPAESSLRWLPVKIAKVQSAAGATATVQGDGSVLISGESPDKDTYSVTFQAPAAGISAIRLEALADPQLPSKGPGRTPHGNFVLTEFAASVAPADKPDAPTSLKFSRAEADAAQDRFPPQDAIDGQPTTGWAIHVDGEWNVDRSLTLHLGQPVNQLPGEQAALWTVKLDQQFGQGHTLGKFRLSLAERVEQNDSRPEGERRREHLERKFATWAERKSKTATPWRLLRPLSATSGVPTLTILGDQSVLASGDMTKRDVYDLAYDGAGLEGITALRLEVLPDPSLPKDGPGRIYYEGPAGDFFLSKFTLLSDSGEPAIEAASHSFASGNNTAAMAIDADPQTGWSINGGQGRAHWAVFQLAEPLTPSGQLRVQLLFERYYAAGLGKFRLWATTDPRAKDASDLPTDVENILALPGERRSDEQVVRLREHFLATAPELAAVHAEIEKLRKSLPALPTTLVMQERPATNPRKTSVHHRGEYLQPKDEVQPEVLSIFPPLASDAPHDRLALARWLVAPENPLVGRVTMNREWGAFFGSGIVRTTEDFGYQGEPPTHPDLLDWLAVELANQGWSMKRMRKMIVMSATYRQSSSVLPQHLAKDPQNKLLAHFPRQRLEAEQLRDSALKISGLLSPKIGGPSVFPPQPASITSEGAYGALTWKVSEGADRYRRGLYTFTKRTAPYAMFQAFDGPSGEACVARRESTNTPLQALTLLNDGVFVEAAQAIGQQAAASTARADELIASIFRRSLVRLPSDREVETIREYYALQRERLKRGELDAVKIAGPGDGNANERAAWTLVARAVLNLDEAIVKE